MTNDNNQVCATLKLANDWLAEHAVKHGAEWVIPTTQWRLETRYSYGEGVLLASHRDSGESFRLYTYGRDDQDAKRWLDLLAYCRS